MDWLLYLVGLSLVKFLQALPLRWVARLGRAGGGLAFVLDRRHRLVACRNLTRALGLDSNPQEATRLAKENFRRLGESYCCAIKTAAMIWDDLQNHVEFVGAEKAVPPGTKDGAPRSLVIAVGHFGNFELYARFTQFLPRFKCATTYRGLRQKSLNRLLLDLRARSGCTFFDRRTDAAALKAWMEPTGCVLGLLADQHAGTGGVRVPFFGEDCSTTASPAVFALRYDCPLRTGICHRVGLANWRIVMGDEIPTREAGKPRDIRDITRDINIAFEAAVRQDPANWFWVHNRWKPDKPKQLPRRSKAPPAPSPTSSLEPTERQ